MRDFAFTSTSGPIGSAAQEASHEAIQPYREAYMHEVAMAFRILSPSPRSLEQPSPPQHPRRRPSSFRRRRLHKSAARVIVAPGTALCCGLPQSRLRRAPLLRIDRRAVTKSSCVANVSSGSIASTTTACSAAGANYSQTLKPKLTSTPPPRDKRAGWLDV